MKTKLHHVLAAALLGALAVLPASAQPWSLRIHQGVVTINGQTVPADQLPSSLNLDELDGSLSLNGFPGPVSPVIELNGAYFVIDSGLLREANEAERKEYDVWARMGRAQRDAMRARDAYVQAHYSQLQNEIQQIEEQSRQMAQVRERDAASLAEQMQARAASAQRLLRNLPNVEMQSYLNGVRNDNAELYGGMVAEFQREQELQELVARIRFLSEGDDRDQLTDQLRGHLNEVFDLKQENRRKEIEQLDAELTSLRARVDERERRRDEIVELRIQELLRTGRFDW